MPMKNVKLNFQRPKAFLKFQMKTKLNTCMSAAVSDDALPVEYKSYMSNTPFSVVQT